jgi:glycosyltransferase involved in cell wall biosynthesis
VIGAAPGTRLHILIIAHAFPPLNAIGSHRPYGWARAWRDMGHDVEVLTARKYAFDGATDLQRDLEGMRVHEVPYMAGGAAPRPPAGVPASVHRWEWLKTLTRRARLSLATFGEPRWLAYRPMLRKGLGLARERSFDFIIATTPPDVALMVARSLSRSTGTPWIADFRDLWFRDLLLYRSRLAAALSGPLNRWLVGDASLLVCISDGLQKRLSEYLGREVIVSRNGFLEEDHQGVPDLPGDGRTHLAYTGRVYPGKQDPAPLFRALARLRTEMPELPNRLAVDFYGYDDPALRRMISRHGVQDCVRLHRFLPYRECMAVQRAAHALLFLDWTDLAGEGMMTGKLLEYLGSRRPILAIGPRTDSEAARLISGTGTGTTLTTESEITEYLKSLVVSPRRADLASEAVQEYSRDRQASRLLEAILAQLRRR